MRIVVALGGNALVHTGSDSSISEQRKAVQETAQHLATLIEDGHEVVVTHGNGPQVGRRMLETAEAGGDTPLDVLVAETQAQIGYLLQQALDNAVDTSEDFLTVVTQTVVEATDEAFDDLTKPVGPFYTESEAEEKGFETREVGDGEQRYRRVVPSPEPRDIVESEEIREMVDRGSHVICCGGGGVPVVQDGALSGVEAVVDKDRASALLAGEVDADELVILTDVEYAYRNYGGDDEEAIERVAVDEMEQLLDSGEFGEGNMRPKVEACIRFIRGGGERAIITMPDTVEQARNGETGTRVVP
ncbi:MAG: carbamate kinase [Candidatus Nanohaloarchaea archaeon]|nr:carbamate kinase [Candidatus Nanohaloarchaea archaeon]